MKIAIISSSVRDGRLSHRVSLFLEKYISKSFGVPVEILDLKEYDFPLFHERFFKLANPSGALSDYAARFKASDGIVIVTPVYNGSFPASLKNVIDLFYAEWVHKPVLVVSVSSGTTPGIATIQSLQAILLKMGARVTGPLYTVTSVGNDYSETGVPANRETAEKYAREPVGELLWMVRKNLEDMA